MRVHSAALILLVLAGCQSAPARIVPPEVVTVAVREYVPVPAALTEPCPVAEVTSRTVEHVVAAANARKLSLVECNRRLRLIRDLGAP